MVKKFLNLGEFLSHPYDAAIDVRSPSEFAEDHVPGAINLPVLDDQERVRVGTIYKQESAFRAKVIGAAMVARNAARHIEGPLADKDGGWQPLVYCWRGGQRSGSFATVLQQIGWRADVVEGGYRTYRRLVVDAMYDKVLKHRLILIDGNTGTAKTAVLHLLRERGVQVLDLEGRANHRGSLFGSMPTPQPSQKAFESALALSLEQIDPSRPVLVEAESSKIGDLLVPPSIWKAMREAPRIRISAPLEARAKYLVEAYGDISANLGSLFNVLDSLVPYQGVERVEGWRKLAVGGDFTTLAGELMALHYDPRYAKSRDAHSIDLAGEIRSDSLSEDALNDIADKLSALVESL